MEGAGEQHGQICLYCVGKMDLRQKREKARKSVTSVSLCCAKLTVDRIKKYLRFKIKGMI